ncbi:hypothetical protein OT109_13945 [Phycisphaeraceae bacterium D3-23]
MISKNVHNLDAILAGAVFSRWHQSANPGDADHVSTTYDKLKALELRNAGVARTQLIRLYTALKDSGQEEHPRFSEIEQFVMLLRSDLAAEDQDAVSVAGSRSQALIERSAQREAEIDAETLQPLNQAGESEWAMPPVTQGDWRPMAPADEDVVRAMLSLLPQDTPKPELCRLQDPPFYDGVTFVELQVRDADSDEPRSVTGMVTEGSVGLLNGNSPVIHEINGRYSECLQITTDNVFDYLWFFCENVHGEDGAFHLLESGPGESPYTQHEIVKNEVVASALAETSLAYDEDEGVWVINTVTYYAHHLFRSCFKVRPTGMIEMVDDDQIAEIEHLHNIRYQGVWRMDTSS